MDPSSWVPELALSALDGPTLEAHATEAGVVEITLIVDDGTQTSNVASFAIVVVDPEAGNELDAQGQCGNCSTGRLAAGSWLTSLILVWGRLRRGPK